MYLRVVRSRSTISDIMLNNKIGFGNKNHIDISRKAIQVVIT